MNSIDRRLGNAVRAGAIAAALLASQANAAEPGGAFTVVYYENAIGSKSLSSGEYGAASEKIRRLSGPQHSYLSIESTNLCVAQMMASQFAAARTTCDDAIRDALNEKATASPWETRRTSRRRYVAIAYANRAVLNWLLKDKASAAADLESAKRFAPRAAFVAQNIAALNAAEVEPTLRLSELP